MDHHKQCFDAPDDGTERRIARVPRRRTSLTGAAVALLLAATFAACGGSDSSSDSSSSSSASTSTQTTAADNGVADKSADEILADATAAAKAASAVHIAGGVGGVELDLTLVRGEGARGTIAQGANEFEIVSVGDAVYLKGSPDFYRQIGGEAAVTLLGDRWLRVPAGGADFGSFAQLTDMGKLLDQALAPEGSTVSKGEVEDAGGQPAVPLTSDRGTLFVAATGEPYPLQIVQTRGSGRITFDGWDEDVELTAPSDAVDVSELQGTRTG
jgi:hypothetical protein